MRKHSQTLPVVAAIVLLAIAASSARAATIVVNSAADGVFLTLPGQPRPCTLRDAITAANTNQFAGGCVKGDPWPIIDTIKFNIGSGTPTIKLKTMLPAITDPVVIQGDSYDAKRVELDGGEASWRAALLGQRAHGLFLLTGDSVIRNLVINRFSGFGIVLTSLDTGGHIEHFTPPEINEPEVPQKPPCFARPAEPDCSPGGGDGGPDLPPIGGGAGMRNTIIGCFIGTDASGTVALGNGSGPDTAGIVTTTDMHIIGGPTAAERNVISGNRGHGLILGGRGHQVRGNYIGVAANGASLGNQFDGINIAGGQFFNASGSIGAAQVPWDGKCKIEINSAGAVLNDRKECGNRIAYNGRYGVLASYNSYEILSNSIFSNGDLGIDVDSFGVTPNDPAGSNRNYPEWIFWRRILSLNPPAIIGTQVTGSIKNRTSGPHIIQVFRNSACDPSGKGEGQELIRTFRVLGNGTFSFTIPVVGGFITATSTPLNIWGLEATSEFSACLGI